MKLAVGARVDWADARGINGFERKADRGDHRPGLRAAHIDGFVREAIPERVRHEVWYRDRGRCVDCGSRERLEFDHIIPVSKGGSNTARNIELHCEACNRRKSASV